MKPLFWDYDFARLRWDKNRDLIMLRVLSAGGMSDWQWLRRRVSADELRGWIIARKGRGLSPRQVTFWGVVLGIPQRTVSRWLKAPERQIWDKR